MVEKAERKGVWVLKATGDIVKPKILCRGFLAPLSPCSQRR
ncbi:MAG: hypothetical protein QXX94_00565 [Candidatus Bathyarchaeia archaeon]